MANDGEIWVLNGPNLGRLGRREPEIYGSITLADVELRLRNKLAALAPEMKLIAHQSNHEGELIDWMEKAAKTARGLIINPGAFAHTSVALLDAVRGAPYPVFEVHISNTQARESFRHHSYLAEATIGIIMGCGVLGYELALVAVLDLVREN
ncbi:MAG: type II 3-dehydroquinate dehydratase [Pseudomonadota bacterium]